MEEMKNRAERFCEEAESFAVRGYLCMTRYLYKSDIDSLKERGFQVIEKEQRNDKKIYCFIAWGMKRDLTFMESQYISGWSDADDIPQTANAAEYCALIALRAQAMAYRDHRDYPENDN